MASLNTWFRDFRDLLSPRFCAVCGHRLNSTEQKICGACLMGLPYISDRDFYDNPSARLFWAKIPIEKAYSYIIYEHDSPSHRLLVQLKYNHRPDLAEWMGRMMALWLQERGFFEGLEAILPVPLHWLRHWQRGYNQSQMLARGVASVTGLPVLKGYARRCRNNESQTRKSATERISNVDSLFQAVRPLPCRHVLLVDDVLTTGATLTSFAWALMKQNPDVQFSVLTMARA